MTQAARLKTDGSRLKPFKDSAEKRHIKLTILGIFVGALISIGIGVLLYILNRQNRFD